MFWRKKRNKNYENLSAYESELDKIKHQSKLEREAIKKIQHDLNEMDENKDALIEQERTLLTDEEIAKTSQVNIEGVEDIEEFIKKNLSPHNKNK